MLETCDVIIVGGGPAGISTALHLLQEDSAWGRRLLVLEKETHPREKLCGGGITAYGGVILQSLGLTPLGVPHVNVNEARVQFEDLRFSLPGKPFFQVVRRAEFDAWLNACARERGVCIRENEPVTAIALDGERAMATTGKSQYAAKVIVGADGSKGLTRSRVGLAGPSRVGRVLEVITPEDPAATPEFSRQFATFDFSSVKQGLQGYYWDFPSLVGGEPYMSRGIFDARVRPRRPIPPLKELLARMLDSRGRSLAQVKLAGHPLHWFSSAGPFSRPRVLLVGDAAGVDPLFGEGISYALAYGKIAAQAIAAAFDTGNFSFADYGQRILASDIGRSLRRRTYAAYWLYAGLDRCLLRLLCQLIKKVRQI